VVERRLNAPLVPRHWVAWDGDEAWLQIPTDENDESSRVRVHPVIGNTTDYVLDGEEDAEVLLRLGLGAPPQKVEL